MKASFATFRVGKEAFTDLAASYRVQKRPPQPPHSGGAVPKSVKASLRDPESLKEAFTDHPW
ncbi:hypothetical protein CFP71_35410 [Amycolatopsis thailandensis]|uniref:Uncharacterized protein n=1 Tax=Amycolatopsis thailandensis TaxID=589330 RepID=A0A229RL68_9PSEU|nr:hypothetical protein CFP71_35410 [Amycolatopsis thailandensis]